VYYEEHHLSSDDISAWKVISRSKTILLSKEEKLIKNYQFRQQHSVYTETDRARYECQAKESQVRPQQQMNSREEFKKYEISEYTPICYQETGYIPDDIPKEARMGLTGGGTPIVDGSQQLSFNPLEPTKALPLSEADVDITIGNASESTVPLNSTIYVEAYPVPDVQDHRIPLVPMVMVVSQDILKENSNPMAVP